MKGVKSANIPGADSGMMEKQIAELQIQNRAHLDKIDSISAEMEGLRKKYDSELEMSNKRIKELEKERDDTASLLKDSISKCESLTSEIEVLKSKLREALDVSKKWEGSANALKILNKYRHNTNKEGLGFQGKNPSKQNLNAPDPTKRDFRKRKYVNLPEYVFCTFCGKNGHKFSACNRGYNFFYSNGKYEIAKKPYPRYKFKQVWVRKDELPPPPNMEGPTKKWVPKTQA